MPDVEPKPDDDGLWAEEHTEPVDRLTRLCDYMTDALEKHPEYRETDKCIIFFDEKTGATTHRGGIVLHGYEDSIEGLVDLFMHLRAIMKANGKDMDIAFFGGPEGASFLSEQ